jgi:hypothetical protein
MPETLEGIKKPAPTFGRSAKHCCMITSVILPVQARQRRTWGAVFHDHHLISDGIFASSASTVLSAEVAWCRRMSFLLGRHQATNRDTNRARPTAGAAGPGFLLRAVHALEVYDPAGEVQIEGG